APRRPGRVHGPAHPDLRLDRAAATGVPRVGGVGHRRPAGGAPEHERAGSIPAQSVPEGADWMNQTGDGAQAIVTPPAEAILETRVLWVRYGENPAVRGISLTIPRNNVVAFIGPSGCGKSTLLRCYNRMNDLVPTARITGTIQ